MELYIGLSDTLLHIGNKETGLYFMMSFFSFFLWLGAIFAVFHEERNLPSFK